MTLLTIFLAINSCLFQLTPSQKNRIVTIQHTRFHADTTRALTFDQFYAQPGQYLSFKPDFIPADYDPRAAYWVELSFCLLNNQEQYILEFYDQTIDSIDVYVLHERDSLFRIYQFGDQLPFDQRTYQHKNFEIPLERQGRYLVYFRVVNQAYADIRVALRPMSEFLSYAINEYFLYGIFYGMILIISLYNVLIYFAIRERKYLYYTFYILSVGLFAMCVDGIAYQMLWSNHPEWNSIAAGIAMYSLIVWSIVFSKQFLKLRLRSPKMNRLLNIVLILRTLVFVYALAFDRSVLDYRDLEIVPLLLIFVASIRVLLRGYKPARFFIVAYGFLFSGFIIKALLMYSILPFRISDYSQTVQILSYYSLHICFLFEMLFLSIALSDRVRILKVNRDRAHRRIVSQHEQNIRYKDKLNAQLERRIEERTLEISDKNEALNQTLNRLEVQKQEISEINSLLDLENWKLRNNLKSAQTDRLLNRHISFDDFQQIFTSQRIGLEFMAQHKWRDGYQCRRCNNLRYTENPETLSRRCTKCGFNETPTSETVFHAIKFPLVKAMYILYLWVVGDEKSLSSLGSEMDIRKNTIWSMRRKIEDYKENYPDEDLDIFKDLEVINSEEI